MGRRPSNFLTSLCGCVITVAANLSWRHFYFSPKPVYTILVENKHVSKQAAELRSPRVAIKVLQGATNSERQMLLKGPWHHQLSLWFPLSIFLRRDRSPSTCALVCSLCWDHSMGYFCKLSNDQTEKIVFLRLPLEAGHDSRAQYPSIFAYPGRVVGCSVCPVHPMRRARVSSISVIWAPIGFMSYLYFRSYRMWKILLPRKHVAEPAPLA